jgi:hypothetical protein
VLAAGTIGPAVAACAGLYPQFDDGKLKPVLALTTGALAFVVTRMALRTPSRLASIGCAIGVSMVLGIANTIIPAYLVTHEGASTGEFGVALLFGVMFGGPVGLFYGLVLAGLVGPVHPNLQRTSLDAADRVKVHAGIWCAIVAALSSRAGFAIGGSFAGPLLAAAVAVAGFAVAGIHRWRLHARRSWTRRVRAGLEPLLRVRELSPYDPTGLPRFAEGSSVVVVEYAPTLPQKDGCYRTGACGVPIAVVADDDMLGA